MHKLLISFATLASLTLGGCSSIGNVVPNALDHLPLIYRPTIQQGNLVTQEMVNTLEPGMSKSQVRFRMGTPMLVDVFHQNRWDYAYTLGEGKRIETTKRTTLYFENDRLVRIAGELKPQPLAERKPVQKEVVVSVPDWEDPGRSIFARALGSVGLGGDDEKQP